MALSHIIRAIKRFLVGGTVHWLEYEVILPLMDEYARSDLAQTFDHIELLKDFAEYFGNQTGIKMGYHSSKGYYVITDGDAEFLQWKLTWL